MIPTIITVPRAPAAATVALSDAVAGGGGGGISADSSPDWNGRPQFGHEVAAIETLLLQSGQFTRLGVFVDICQFVVESESVSIFHIIGTGNKHLSETTAYLVHETRSLRMAHMQTILSIVMFCLLLTNCSSGVKNTASPTPSPMTSMEERRAKVVRLAEQYEKCGQLILEADLLVKNDGSPATEYQTSQQAIGAKFFYIAGSLRRLSADDQKLAQFKNDPFFHTLKTTNLDGLRDILTSDDVIKSKPNLKQRFEDQNACIGSIIAAEWDLVGLVETQTVTETRKTEAAQQSAREAEITAKRHAECVRQREAANLDTAPCAEWAKER